MPRADPSLGTSWAFRSGAGPSGASHHSSGTAASRASASAIKAAAQDFLQPVEDDLIHQAQIIGYTIRITAFLDGCHPNGVIIV